MDGELATSFFTRAGVQPSPEATHIQVWLEVVDTIQVAYYFVQPPCTLDHCFPKGGRTTAEDYHLLHIPTECTNMECSQLILFVYGRDE